MQGRLRGLFSSPILTSPFPTNQVKKYQTQLIVSYAPDHPNQKTKTILQKACFVATLSWEVEAKSEIIPPKCPEGKFFCYSDLEGMLCIRPSPTNASATQTSVCISGSRFPKGYRL